MNGYEEMHSFARSEKNLMLIIIINKMKQNKTKIKINKIIILDALTVCGGLFFPSPHLSMPLFHTFESLV